MQMTYRDLRAYKYELAETLTLKTHIHPIGPAIHTDYLDLTEEGTLIVRRGYCWDGPSGPAIDTPSFMRGSLVHDAFYQLIRMGLLPVSKRGEADRLLFKTCLEDGMNPIRARWVYTTVRGMGWTSCRPRPEDRAKLLVAP